MASKRRVFYLLIALASAAGCADPRVAGAPANNRTESSPSPTATASDLGYYDGEIHGWDIGPNADDKGRGLNDLDCTPRRTGAGERTDLDFRITYLPKNIGRPAHEPGVTKYVCGDLGLSVTYNFDWDDNPFDGIATLRIERVLTAVRARALYAPRDLVEACTIGGSPAVCVHYEDDARGRTNSASILVIQDDTPDPYMTTLLITDAGGIPFNELVKIAEGIR